MNRPASTQSQQRPEDVAARVSEFAQQLRVEFADAIRDDAHAFKMAVLRYVQHELPPHAGRPTSPHLDQAEQLRGKGLTWREVCRFINPEFQAYERFRQQHYIESVRKALAARKRGRRRKRAKSDELVAPEETQA